MKTRLNRMGWPMVAALAITVTGAATPVAAPAQSAAASKVVELDTSQGRLITLPRPISDVFVADDKIADVQVRSPTQIYIFGKAQGQTTISATTKTGQVIYFATIRVGQNFSGIDQMLKLAMPEADLKSYTLNGVVLLTGTVLNPADAQQAEALVQAFVGPNTKVISRIKAATPLQVNLQVKFAEVSKSFVKNIGANLTTLDGTGGFQFGIGSGRTVTSQFNALGGPLGIGSTASKCIPPILANGSCTGTIPGTAITPGPQNSTIGGMGKFLGLDILGALDLGETDGQVVTLAQPNLSAISGETGSFLAGGEIPIPISQGLGAVSVEYKQYGVSLSYTPTVLSDGRINLRVRPEVSQLSAAGAVTIGNVQIPALTTRRAETTVELGSGQSMVIGGLLQNSTDNQITKTPGIGDVPILGALFRSNGWKRNETELMIVITPYLVKPINANDIVLPTDGYKAPTDLGRVFMGRLGEGSTGGSRPKPTMAAPNTAPGMGLDTPVGPVPQGPQPGSNPAAVETKALPPQPSKKKKGDGDDAAPGFSL